MIGSELLSSESGFEKKVILILYLSFFQTLSNEVYLSSFQQLF